jgi:uncharacterized protein (TIGR03437 family)
VNKQYLCLLLALVPSLSGQPAGLTLNWTKPFPGASSLRIVARPDGIWAAGYYYDPLIPGAIIANSHVFVSRMTTSGEVVWTTRLAGSGREFFNALTVDRNGNTYIGGSTPSENFPDTNPFDTGSRSVTNGFLAKLDSNGAISSSTVLGGGADVRAFALGEDGGLFVAGTAGPTRFRTTPGAALGTYSGLSSTSTLAFVARFSPAGDRLIYATLLGGTSGPCTSSSCVFSSAYSAPSAIVPDGAGNVWVSGSTTAFDFPTTPDAFIHSVPSGYSYILSKLFLTKINALGTKLIYSSYAGSRTGEDASVSMHLGTDGSVVLTGNTQSTDFPVTDGSTSKYGSTVGFLSVFSSDGTILQYATYRDLIGQAEGPPNGTIWLSGRDKSRLDYIELLEIASRKTLFRRPLPPMIAGSAIAANASSVYLASSDSVTRLDTSGDSLGGVVGVSSATGGPYRNTVSAGELVSIFGINLGPREPVLAKYDADDRVGSELGGVKVYFAGIIAPLLYVDALQINAVVPFGVGKNLDPSLQILRDDQLIFTGTMRTVVAQPEIFRVAVNQNGVYNSTNSGDIITFWATGCGDLKPRPIDGSIGVANPAALQQPFTVELDGQPLEILYAGPAPGMVAGIQQFNVRLPKKVTAYSSRIVLKTGNYQSAPIVIFVR